MHDENVVTIEGNLTNAPVLIEREGRTPLCLLRIACNRSRLNPKTGEWENHPRFFEGKVYGPRATEVSTYAKGQKVRINEGYLDWYEKGKGAERREYVSIVAANTPDGIKLVPKAEAQPQANEEAQAPEQTPAGEQGQASEQSEAPEQVQASEEPQAPEQAQADTGSDDAPASPAKGASKPVNSRKASGGTSSAKSTTKSKDTKGNSTKK